jgi:hypothetical protein
MVRSEVRIYPDFDLPLLILAQLGWTTAMAISNAYVSDIVDPAARSRIFSLYTGAIFGGMAIGPTLGALLTRHTNDLLTVFYIGTSLHALNTVLCITILPESLNEKERIAAKERYHSSQVANHRGWLSTAWNMAATFAQPLAVFIPRRRSNGRDWNITLVGIAYGSAMLNAGSYAFKFQYAISAFGWGTTELGYWMSIIGVTRATYLVILLPLLLKLLHMIYSRSSSVVRTHTHLDLLVARLSLVVEVLGYTATALIVDPITFAIATCWLSLSGGFGPSVQSLALALFVDQEGDNAKPINEQHGSTTTEERQEPSTASASETGRLFGALSVLQSLTSQIIGPSLFGAVFINTIGTAPRAIFWVSAGCIGVAGLALSMVRLNVGSEREDGREEVDEESRLLG